MPFVLLEGTLIAFNNAYHESSLRSSLNLMLPNRRAFPLIANLMDITALSISSLFNSIQPSLPSLAFLRPLPSGPPITPQGMVYMLRNFLALSSLKFQILIPLPPLFPPQHSICLPLLESIILHPQFPHYLLLLDRCYQHLLVPFLKPSQSSGPGGGRKKLGL